MIHCINNLVKEKRWFTGADVCDVGTKRVDAEAKRIDVQQGCKVLICQFITYSSRSFLRVMSSFVMDIAQMLYQ